MSEKRTSTESRIHNDEQTIEDSDAVFRQEDNGGSGNFASISDTTIQDIPIEMLQCILVKAITMEVKNMKLVRSVWKEKADLVISRLGSVCSQWSSVLTTDFFRIELHRTLDGIAQQKIRMEIVQESLVVRCHTLGIVALKDDILLLCLRYENEHTSEISAVYSIKVYDRNNMAEVKDDIVIELPGFYDEEIAACNVSNCVYVLKENIETDISSVLRITKDEDQKFNIQSWITDLRYPVDSISVSDEGRVILTSTLDDELGRHIVSVYDPNGLLHHEVIWTPDIYGFECIDCGVIRKSNGNIVLGSVSRELQMVLTEIDTNGIFQRQYKSSLEPIRCMNFMSFVDASGRMLIYNMYNKIELLDSELNLLEFTGPQSNLDNLAFLNSVHFNSQRNEVIGICSVRSNQNTNLIKIFRFVEE